jgi:hypothetical protein
MHKLTRVLFTLAGGGAICGMTMGAASSCGGSGGKPARSASRAGNGVTQFGVPGKSGYANRGATGKLKWDKTYNAHKVNAADVENCRWSLYSIDSEGVTKFIKKGNYANAKIRVGEQVTRKFYLKSLDCGFWE